MQLRSIVVRCLVRCALPSSSDEVNLVQEEVRQVVTTLIYYTLTGRTHEKIYKSKQKPPMHNEYNSRDAFRLGTLGGAEALNLADQIGSIEVGKKADLLVFDAMTANLAGIRDPFHGIVFHASDADIAMVMVDGEIVKRDGKLTKFEWAKVARELMDSADAVRQRFPENTLEEMWQRFYSQGGGPSHWAK
jgi:formylmethanofuran dehydrogenase subunit A